MDETQINTPMPVAPATAPMEAKLPKAGAMFKEAWAIYKARFGTLILISIIPIVAYALAGTVFVGGGVVAVILAKVLHINLVALGVVGILIGLVVLIALIYLGIWGTVAELFAIKDHEENIGWKESYRRSKAVINQFFFTSLLAGLIIAGGFILLIVPGIIFAVWYSQVSWVVLTENFKGMTAIKRSKAYVTGRWGEVFGKLFYIGLITMLVYIVIGIVVGILFGSAAVPGSTHSNVSSLISNIAGIFVTPLVSCYAFVLYKAIVATRQP